MEEKIKNRLKQLRRQGTIDEHQFKTYMGQINSGNLEGCIKGMKRKKLIGGNG